MKSSEKARYVDGVRYVWVWSNVVKRIALMTPLMIVGWPALKLGHWCDRALDRLQVRWPAWRREAATPARVRYMVHTPNADYYTQGIFLVENGIVVEAAKTTSHGDLSHFLGRPWERVSLDMASLWKSWSSKANDNVYPEVVRLDENGHPTSPTHDHTHRG